MAMCLDKKKTHDTNVRGRSTSAKNASVHKPHDACRGREAAGTRAEIAPSGRTRTPSARARPRLAVQELAPQTVVNPFLLMILLRHKLPQRLL